MRFETWSTAFSSVSGKDSIFLGEHRHRTVNLLFGVEQAGCHAHHRADVAVHGIHHDAVLIEVGGDLIAVLALDPET